MVFLSNFVFSVSPSTVSELDCDEPFAAFVILSPVLLPMKSLLASADFWIALFEAVLRASVADCLAGSESFWLY